MTDPCPFCDPDAARAAILDRFRDRPPDGFNIGINAGASAGQTVMHLRVHLIPRWTGDVPNPRGGVRHVMPGKGNYDPNQPPSVFASGPAEPEANPPLKRHRPGQ